MDGVIAAKPTGVTEPENLVGFCDAVLAALEKPRKLEMIRNMARACNGHLPFSKEDWIVHVLREFSPAELATVTRKVLMNRVNEILGFYPSQRVFERALAEARK